ncbi:3-oxoacyl-[acyl-carrier protein] reductase [Lachnospiraceae bacterium KM106-2]|nr:3-oxoacyl-[acyl-carrier protein] reductase [Lachnospiraceae bacterium KM106-2]
MLKGKNAIITGCNRGIGRAIVEQFAKNGCNIWACARTKNEAFEEDMNQVALEYGVTIRPVYFDLSREEEIKAAVKEIGSQKKSIDILVNNAGKAHGGLMQMTSMETLKEVFEINYFSQIYLIQQVSKYMMRKKQGSIVNMVSVGGIETNPGYLCYGSSKAALIWATQMISKELAPFHIRVNGVAPGLTNTEMGHYKSEEELNKVLARTSLKRMAEPEEIAKAVLYLASDDSSFVTGQILRVDGGRS